MLVAGQIMLVLLGLVSIGLFPPATGQILLVPVTDQGRAHLLRHALRAGAALVVTGPVAGSYVVYGERARIAPHILGDGVLAVAASSSLCGMSA